MKSRWIGLVVFLSFTAIIFSLAPKFVPVLGGSSAWGDDDDKLSFPKNATCYYSDHDTTLHRAVDR